MIDISASVHPSAKIGKGVEIGPYCVVGPDVELGAGVRLEDHVVVKGRTRIDPYTQVFSFAAIGNPPQDRKYKGEPSELVIGANCIIREHVTINPGTEGGGMLTKVGDHCLILAGAHIAHDCLVGDHVTIVNNALLSGHVTVEDYAVIGGGAGIHQFVRIGAQAMIGGMAAVEHDVIPFGMAVGNRAYLEGLNLVGLRRRGFDRREIKALQQAYEFLFSDDGALLDRIAQARSKFAEKLVQQVLEFMEAPSRRSMTMPLKTDHKSALAA